MEKSYDLDSDLFGYKSGPACRRRKNFDWFFSFQSKRIGWVVEHFYGERFHCEMCVAFHYGVIQQTISFSSVLHKHPATYGCTTLICMLQAEF